MNTDKKRDGAPSDISKSSSLVEPLPPFTGHFFDQTAAAAKARLIYYKIMLFRTMIIVIALFAIFSIYWGALFDIPARSLQGWIVVRIPLLCLFSRSQCSVGFRRRPDWSGRVDGARGSIWETHLMAYSVSISVSERAKRRCFSCR